MSYDVDLVEQYAVKAVSCDVRCSFRLVLWCRFRTVSKGCVLCCATNLWFSYRFGIIWNLVGGASKIPSLKGWAQCLLRVLQVLNNKKTLQGWSCSCGGFPEISKGQMVDQTWPWKIKALHMQCMALLAPGGQGLQHEFQVIPGIGFCYVLGM